MEVTEKLTTTVPQRRSILAILSGTVLIAVCVFFVAIDIAGFFDPINPPFFPLFLAPFAILLAVLAVRQYWTLFCCERLLARAYYEAYFVIGGIQMFCGITNLLEKFSNLQNKTALFFCGGMFLCGLIFLLVGYINYRQTLSRQRAYATLISSSDSQWKQSYQTRKITGVFLLSLITIALAAFFVYDERRTPIFAEHLSYEQFPYQDSFPSDGSDFSYRRGYRGTMYCEFTITEQGFRNWIESQSRWEYCEPIPIDKGIEIQYRIKNEDYKREDNVIVTQGLDAGYGRGKGGRAVFDSLTNRAYYWTYY